MSPSASHHREHLFWINVIRAVAAFGVVMVHVAADVITEWGVVPKDWWWAANVFDSLERGCVPIFIMVSGALLLSSRESYKDFFTKRFNRVFIPFITWTLFYLLWKKLFYLPDMGFAEALSRVVSGNVIFHLWFFYVLAGMYLVTPIFRILIAHARPKDVFYFIVLWFMAGSLLPFIQKVMVMGGNPDFHFNLPMEPVQGFIGYFVLGYFIRQYVLEKWVPLAGMVWTGCLAFCLVGTWLLARHFQGFKELFYDNLAPNIVFYCASFFILVKFMVPAVEGRIPSGVKSAVIGISRASFGIYLIHPAVLDVLVKGRLGFTLRADTFHPVFMIPLIAVVGYAVSGIITLGIQKVPFLKKIV